MQHGLCYRCAVSEDVVTVIFGERTIPIGSMLVGR
jgi:hypothetical protein